MPEAFHFQQAEWFWLLLPLALLIWLLHQRLDQSSAWRKVCDARLLPYLMSAQPARQVWLPTVLLLAGGLLAILALADPVWEQQEQPVFRNEAARVIVLDLSSSMLSPDLKPARMVRARYKVADMLGQDLDGQTGLVVFAGDAFAVAPLTHDVDTIQALLSPLEPALMPVQGSRVDLGLQKAAELMQQAGIQQGDILLLTDGFEDERSLAAARHVRKEGYRVSVLAVGTDEGAPIPATRGGLLRDEAGDVVMPALGQQALRQLATAGGGNYALISGGDDDVAYLLAQLTPQLGEHADQSGLTTDAWRSNGPWLAILLLPLAALAFRRGWLLSLLLLTGIGMSTPEPAMAFGWNDLWLRADQQAERALQAGDAAQAAALAQDPALRGTAAYQADDFEAALDSFTVGTGVDADYNEGNALARLQRYEEAIAAYDRALAQQPEMADAVHNKAEVEKILQQQQQDQEKQDQQGDQDQQSENQQDEQNQQGEQGQQDSQQGDAGEAGESQQEQTGEGSGQSGEPSPGEDKNAAAGADGQDGAETADEQQAEGQAQDQDQEQEPQPASPQERQAQADAGSAADEARDAAAAAQATAEPLDSEEQRAAEQWLRRIPDDPAGLLRRKFLYQYKQRAARSGETGSQQW